MPWTNTGNIMGPQGAVGPRADVSLTPLDLSLLENGGWTLETTVVPEGSYRSFSTTVNRFIGTNSSGFIPLDRNRFYRYSFEINSSTTGQVTYIDMNWKNASKAQIGPSPRILDNYTIPANTWTAHSGYIGIGMDVVPAANVAGINPYIFANHTNGTQGGTLYLADFRIIDVTDVVELVLSDKWLATTTVNGSMSAVDKAKLNAATVTAANNTLMLRSASGTVHVKTGTGVDDATNKAYVDAKTWDGSSITTGTISDLRIANATSALDGLMPKADKAKLDAATSAPTASTVAMRNSAGRVQVTDPGTDTTAATPKSYVDAKTWDGADITTGTVATARLPAATQSAAGTLSAADKLKLDAATQLSTASTLAMRSSTGTLDVATQTVAAHVTRKDYVDAQVATRAASSHTHTLEDVTITQIGASQDLNTYLTTGLYHQSSNANTSLALNYPEVNAGFLEVFAVPNFTYQRYMVYGPGGAEVYWRAKYSTSAFTAWFRVADTALATGTTNGLMSAADKALIDTATYTAVGSSLVQRHSSGAVHVVTGTGSSDATTKGYVDGQIATREPTISDTGWQTTGLTFTAQTNFTVGTYKVRKINKEVWMELNLTYTGTGITTGSDGNVGDTNMVITPSGYRPTGGTWSLDAVARGTVAMWFGSISSGGYMVLNSGIPGNTLATNGTLVIRTRFLTD